MKGQSTYRAAFERGVNPQGSAGLVTWRATATKTGVRPADGRTITVSRTVTITKRNAFQAQQLAERQAQQILAGEIVWFPIGPIMAESRRIS